MMSAPPLSECSLRRWAPLAEHFGVRLALVPAIPSRYAQLGLDDVGYRGSSPRTIFVCPTTKEYWLVHELAHLAVATPRERRCNNWGFGRRVLPTPEWEEVREGQAVDLTVALWLFRNAALIPGPCVAWLADELSCEAFWKTSPAEYAVLIHHHWPAGPQSLAYGLCNFRLRFADPYDQGRLP